MVSPSFKFRFSIFVLLAAAGVLPFLQPGHLDLLELALVRALRVVGEPLEPRHPLVQVGEADAKRVGVRKLFQQGQGDPLGVVPGQFVGHHTLPGTLGRTSILACPVPKNPSIPGRLTAPDRQECLSYSSFLAVPAIMDSPPSLPSLGLHAGSSFTHIPPPS